MITSEKGELTEWPSLYGPEVRHTAYFFIFTSQKTQYMKLGRGKLHKMISVSQIRAARALLGWTQGDLAQKCGLSLRALNSIERGLAVPRLDNLRSIQEAFEKNRIEFLPGDGVRRQTERLDILQHDGVDCREQLLVDIVREVPVKGEILFNLGSEEKLMGINHTVFDECFSQLSKRGVTERVLVAKGETYIIGEPSSYRWIRPDIFNQAASIIYGDNIAFLILSAPHRVVIIRNPSVAEMFRRQFDHHWALAETPWFAKRYKNPCPDKPWSVAKAAAAREWISHSRSYVDRAT